MNRLNEYLSEHPAPAPAADEHREPMPTHSKCVLAKINEYLAVMVIALTAVFIIVALLAPQ
jgi:hypothetical protein